MIFTIYLITNKLNGKVYVGQTKQTLLRRWRAHLQDARRGEEQPLYRAIRKYGKENFSIESILTVEAQEEANYQERIWIILMGAHVSQHGYVCTWGGDGRTGINDETRFKRVNAFRKTLAKEPARHPRYRDDIKDEEIAHLYVNEKWTRGQIADKMKCSDQLIADRMRKLGIRVEKGRHRVGWKHPDPLFLSRLPNKGTNNWRYRPDLDTEEMIQLYDAGLTLKKIGKELGCTASCVKQRFEQIGKARRSTSFVPNPTLDTNLMAKLYEEGLTLKQIGEKLGCEGSAVRYRLKRIGLKLRPSNNVPRTKEQ